MSDPLPEHSRPEFPWRQRRVVILTAGGANPQILINALAHQFPDIAVIRERPESKWTILKRRARRLGWIEAMGQIATMVVSRLGKKFATRRADEIIEEYGLSTKIDPAIPVHDVLSVNDPACLAAIGKLQPAVVVVLSTRLLSGETLARIPCPVINFHAGVNPGYRGQMGGYWALVNGDPENFGATVHLVDTGVDTGATLHVQKVTPSRSDTMLTYPLLLTAASTGIAIRAVDDVLAGRMRPYAPEGPSKMHYNPAVWTWLRHGLTKRIW